MIPIRKIGTILPIDEDGYVVNVSNVAKIKSPWSEVVEYAKNGYIMHFGAEIDSIYVRGSVVKGTAIEGISDLDTFTVLRGVENEFNDAWIEEFVGEAKAKFPFCQKLEIELIPLDGLLDFESDEYLADRLMIKTQSVCIYGKDLAPQLPGFKPDNSIAFNMHAIDELLSIAKQKLAETEDLEAISAIGTWIMKRLLRTGFELVMEVEQAYTRDLYLCYKIFSKYYPERESDMRQVLELALNPVSDKLVILEIVDGFGGRIVKEAALKFPR